MQLNIANDYTKCPGGRNISDGENSGEDFREKILVPKYLEAVEKNEKLIVNLDGGYGYGSSFLEEAFGGLVRKLGTIDVSRLQIISNEEPMLVDDVKKYMEDALKGSKK